MKFDSKINEKLQNMDSRLKQLDKITSQESKSDTKKSHKGIK